MFKLNRKLTEEIPPGIHSIKSDPSLKIHLPLVYLNDKVSR